MDINFLVSTGAELLGLLLVFIFGAITSLTLSRTFGVSPRRSMALYLWHTMFCVVYALYVMNNGGDALGYYEISRSGGATFEYGTAAVNFIATFFSSFIGLSFLGTSLAFNIFGFIGLLAFEGSLRQVVAQKSTLVKWMARAVVMLPSISFWSGGLGKDAIAFLATGLALWSAISRMGRLSYFFVACAIMFLVRPHMAGLLVIAYGGSLFMQDGVSFSKRLALILGMTILAAVIVPLSLHYAGVSDSTVAGVSSYIDQRASYNTDGGGGVDLTSMSPPMKLVTYLFRPLPFEVKSLSALAASLDNVVLLGVLIIAGWNGFRKRTALNFNRAFLWFYALAAWLILAFTTANLGISVRQKWMFVPMIIFLCFVSVGRASRNHRGMDAVVAGEDCLVVEKA